MHHQSGFTIVELIAVMVITAVLAAVTAPRFIGNDAFAARGAHSSLLAALRLAQKTAIAQRTIVFVNIDTATREVCLGYTSDCGTALIDSATQSAYVKTLSSSVNLGPSANPIAFDGLGRETSNQTVTVTIQNNVDLAEPLRTITIERETGYVR